MALPVKNTFVHFGVQPSLPRSVTWPAALDSLDSPAVAPRGTKGPAPGAGEDCCGGGGGSGGRAAPTPSTTYNSPRSSLDSPCCLMLPAAPRHAPEGPAERWPRGDAQQPRPFASLQLPEWVYEPDDVDEDDGADGGSSTWSLSAPPSPAASPAPASSRKPELAAQARPRSISGVCWADLVEGEEEEYEEEEAGGENAPQAAPVAGQLAWRPGVCRVGAASSDLEVNDVTGAPALPAPGMPMAGGIARAASAWAEGVALPAYAAQAAVLQLVF
mmetsp:Transcript_107703/g.347648  ORF Transcript_107703/g.347648 Transcript_107703/m.347648 type:complete len:273 (-) Transcript_107703:471-1289(-)